MLTTVDLHGFMNLNRPSWKLDYYFYYDSIAFMGENTPKLNGREAVIRQSNTRWPAAKEVTIQKRVRDRYVAPLIEKSGVV